MGMPLSIRRHLPLLQGPVATLALIACVELSAQYYFKIPNPPAFLVLTVVYAAFSGGILPGLISAAFSWIYISYFFSLPNDPFEYTDENVWRVTAWGIAAPAIALLVGLLRTRAEQARLEQLRLRTEERFRKLFENNPQPMWVYELSSLRFLMVNDAALLKYGYTKDEFLSMTIKDIRPPEDLPALLHTIETIPPTVLQSGPWRHRLKDGTIILVELSSHDLDFDGVRTRLVLASDITQRVEAEERLRNLTDELEVRIKDRTAQLESALKELELFSYSVSHDLRAPLRAIEGFARILLADHKDSLDSEGQRFLDIIVSSTKNMSLLIDDLLDLARIGRKELAVESVDMETLVGHVLDELKAGESTRSVTVDIKPLKPCFADRGLIKQVWANLLGNAFKFTRPIDGAHIELGSSVAHDSITYYVHDNGVGFDMQYASKLFGVFQRLHSADEFEGTGVGLAIVQRIVGKHGGRVWAESGPNHGTTFSFTLPFKGTM